MKTYDQLTNSQKTDAIAYAKDQLKSLLRDGIIDFGNGDGLSDSTIDYYAIAAAEGSFYAESGDLIVEGITE